MATTNKRFVAKNGLDNNNQTITNIGAAGTSLGLSGTGDLTIAVSGTATLTIPSGSDTLVTLSGAQTLTNKTISGSNNTLSNIGNGSLTNSSVSFNGVSVALGASGTLYTDDISEDGSPVNLWFTNTRARAAVSVTDSGGDGSLSYDNGTGVITYTGPSATEVRAHLSAGTGLTYTSGQFAIDSTVVTLTGTQTLTNKTISGADNTLSNIGNGSLTNSSITINGTSVSLGGTRTLVTDDVAEDGSPINLWYTDTRSRAAISVSDTGGDGSLSYNSGTGVITYTGPSATEVRAHFSAGTGVTLSSGQISIGQAVATTDNVTFAGVTADNVRVGVTAAGEIDTSTGNLTVDSAGGTTVLDDDVNVTGNMTIDGNLTVSGTTVTINATNLAVEDNMIYLNNGSTVTHPDLGFAGNYNDGTYRHAGLFRDESDGRWKFFHQYTPEPDASAYIDITHASFALAPVQASSFIGNVTGNVTGNASTATAWQTARTLTLSGDVTGTSAAFDGSGNISITTTIAADSVALGTDTTGNYVASINNGNYITGGNGGSEGAALTLAVDATSANTASKVVARDASGNFSAGTITATLSGNASTVTNGVYTTDTGTVTNTMLAGSIANNKLANSTISGISLGSNLGTLTLGVSGTGLSGSASYNGSTGTTFTVTSNATSANTASTIVARDASGNFTAGTITAALNGNASTATSATTAGTVTTAAQPAITSLGTLTGLTVTTGSTGTTATIVGAAGRGLVFGQDGGGNYIESFGTNASNRVWRIQAYDGTSVYTSLSFDPTNSRAYFSSASLGIGTSSPISKLDLRGSHTGGYGILNIVSTDNSLISIDSSSVYDTGLRLKYQTADKWLVGIRGSDSFTFANASDSRILTITQAGNVGINTTSPGRALTIASGEIGLTQGYGITWNSGDNYIKGVAGYALQFTTYDGGSSQNEVMRLTGGTIGAGGGATALFGTTVASTTGGFTNTRMVIKQIADGGTGGGLHIEQNSNTNVAYFGFTGSAFRIGTSYRSTGSYQPMDFYTGPTVASSMILNTSGNLGIGTSSPVYKLDVVGDISARGSDPYFILTPNSGTYVFFQKLSASNGDYLRLYDGTAYSMVWKDGNVGIGTTSPGSRLEVTNAGASVGNYLRLNNTIGKNWELMAGISGISNDGFGIYSVTDSAYRFVISSGGNVGIGTTSPTAKLEVQSGEIRITSSATQRTHFNYVDGGSNYISMSNGGETVIRNSSSNLVTFQGGGNVGIGTSSPLSLLNVNGSAVSGITSASGAAVVTVGSSNNYPSLELAIANTYNAQVRTYGNDLELFGGHFRTIGNVSSEDHSIRFYTSQAGSANWSTAKMILNHNGNVGIGTTSPNAKFTVVGASADSSSDLIYTTGYNGKSFFSVHQLGFVRVRSADINGAAVHYFDNSGNKRMEMSVSSIGMQYYSDAIASTWLYLHNQGRIGINVVPDVALSVNGVVHIGNGGNFVYMGGTAGSSGSWGSRHYTSSGNNVNNANTFQFDNVGYGSTWTVTFNGSGITASGNITAYSDVRLKENIMKIENALDKVQQLRGITYTRNDTGDTTKRHAGVIAQEVEHVLPEVVDETPSGIKHVAYGNMVGLLIEAIKELKKENELLTSRINKITGDVE